MQVAWGAASPTAVVKKPVLQAIKGTRHITLYVKSSAGQSQLSPTPQPLPSSCPDTRSDSRKTTVVTCPALRGEKRLHMDALV